jgi:hypothetical protein
MVSGARAAWRSWWPASVAFMLALPAVALVACASATLSATPRATMLPGTSVSVSLGLYSGRPDPSWTLTESQAIELDRLLGALPAATGIPPEGGLGYHGFAIAVTRPGQADEYLIAFRGAVASPGTGLRVHRVDAGRAVERFLLETGQPSLSAAEINQVEMDLGGPGS